MDNSFIDIKYCLQYFMETLKIHYMNNLSELCEIGKKYDTDKSSQRNNVTLIHYFMRDYLKIKEMNP
jgi:hypothetical protein